VPSEKEIFMAEIEGLSGYGRVGRERDGPFDVHPEEHVQQPCNAFTEKAEEKGVSRFRFFELVGTMRSHQRDFQGSRMHPVRP
jgi:hypothetical protein